MEVTELELTRAVWRRATASGPDGTECVEVAAVWGTKDGVRQRMVAVRDSKDRDGGAVLGFTRAELAAFVDGARKGEFDDLI